MGISLSIVLIAADAGGFLASVLGFGDPIDEFFDLSTWLAAIAGALVILFAWNAIEGRRTA